jgi:hypothetical protein
MVYNCRRISRKEKKGPPAAFRDGDKVATERRRKEKQKLWLPFDIFQVKENIKF